MAEQGAKVGMVQASNKAIPGSKQEKATKQHNQWLFSAGNISGESWEAL